MIGLSKSKTIGKAEAGDQPAIETTYPPSMDANAASRVNKSIIYVYSPRN